MHYQQWDYITGYSNSNIEKVVSESDERAKILSSLVTAVEEKPVTILFGCRGSGKTTLVKKALPNADYVDLFRDDPADVIDMTLRRSDGVPLVMDEFDQFADALVASGKRDASRFLQGISSRRPVVLVMPYQNFYWSTNFYRGLMEDEWVQNNAAYVANPLWSDELMAEVCMKGFGVCHAFAKDFATCSSGLPRMINLLAMSLGSNQHDYCPTIRFADFNLFLRHGCYSDILKKFIVPDPNHCPGLGGLVFRVGVTADASEGYIIRSPVLRYALAQDKGWWEIADLLHEEIEMLRCIDLGGDFRDSCKCSEK